MEREACLRAGGSRGWMSGLKLAVASPDLTSIGVAIYRLSLRWGVLFSQVVKTARSRGRTERTLLSTGPSRGAPRLGQAGRSGTGGMLRTGLIRHFWCHITVCYTQLITPTRADELPVVGG